MSVTVTATVGPKGRVVIPQSVRQRRGWLEGTELVFCDDADGVRVMSAQEALAQFRLSIAGTASPVAELLAERRQAATRGD